ncbi:uncharacterized protein B0J16DRAFT_323135 [Fusarium flagelliforme]|uniref:uncharacterized protein n=1 Tax=Fusarium flagelliforme TaxID=2675880 RepID=UPI001E8DCAD1|nr:uncharacterized protein B0J16DRAFT_323135 [Fusarium flagelliforme]KAH7179656.1 hypothetical protein B0J16DRAFT_323135 [Fusarium flagelliforme]
MTESDPGRSASPDVAPAAFEGTRLGYRSDRVRKHLETILMSFRFGFESLPSEAQQAYTNFQQNNDFPAFGSALRQLLLDENLEDFIRESPAFLHAATKLFDSRYPLLGLKARLNDLTGRRGKSSSKAQSRRSPGSRRGSKREARRNTESRHSGDDSSAPASARVTRTLTLDSRTRQKKSQKGQSVKHIRFEAGLPSGVTKIPIINIEPAGATSNIGDQPTPANTPVIPGFVMSTRTSPKEQETPKSKNEELRKRLTELNSQLNKLTEARGGYSLDFNLYPYKGWKVEQPRVLLHRARNFLADEDIDRTLNWSQKFAELTEYLSYLTHNYRGEAWGADLREVIEMLHAHSVFQKYHYGNPKLNLKFDTAWPKGSKRLPPLPGTEHSIEKSDKVKEDNLGERKLLLNKIRPAIDVHYKVPSKVLSKYIECYTSEARDFWGFTPASAHPRLGLMSIENDTYEECLSSNISTTCKNIEAAEAKFKAESDKKHFSPNALRAFATLRGTRRAAVQQSLSHLNNAENLAVCNVFRTLILPKPKIPEKPDAGIVIPTMQVTEVPEKESRDPFGFTLAHKWYTRADRHWGDWEYKHAVKECHGHRLWENRKEPIMDLPKNFKGPYAHDCLDHEMKKIRLLLKRCEALYDRILLEKERTPRKFMTNVSQSLLDGLEGKNWEMTDLKFYKDDLVPDSRDLIHVRPKEEDFLRLLGEHSTNKKMVTYKTKDVKSGSRFDIFEQRVKKMFYGEGTTIVHCYTFEEFMQELNRDCDGPVKRWRFSENETWENALNLQNETGLITIYGTEGGGYILYRAEANLHPEQLIRWLDVDKDLDAFVQGVDLANIREGEENAEVGHERDEIDTISTKISVQESEDLGDYMFGLPKIENLRSWEELAEDASDVESSKLQQDMRKTKDFYRCLCFRLGKTIHDLQAKQETIRRQLTPRQQELNRDFVDLVTRVWDSDARERPDKKDKNPKKGGLKRVTPSYQDIIRMMKPEIYDPTWEMRPVTEGFPGDTLIRETIRKGIIREAYENKSMIFPSRIDRYTNQDGFTVELPRRHEPVWSFAHPERKTKAPRYWDMNRWPLHLQSETTAERIRSGAFSGGVSRKPAAPSPIATPPLSPTRPIKWETSRETTRLRRQGEEYTAEDIAEGTAAPLIPTEDMATSPGPVEDTGTSEQHDQIIPGLGEDFVVTFADLANSRRTFTPGPPRYFLGDTPLQKKYIEDYIKRGIVPTEQPPTWRHRLGALMGRRQVEDDPTALPEVHPRDVPKSRPRLESSEYLDYESSAEMLDVMDNDDIDVEMEELVTRRPYDEELPSPMMLSLPHSSSVEHAPPVEDDFATEPIPEVPEEFGIAYGQADLSLTEQGEQLVQMSLSQRSRSRHLMSDRLNLTIEEPESPTTVEYTDEETSASVRKALSESD